MTNDMMEMQIDLAETKLAQKLLAAFTAEVGCKPSEAEIVRRVKIDGDVVLFIRKRETDGRVIQLVNKD